MNKQVQELAKQAGVPYQIELEEFARLVIQEYNKEVKESRRAVKSQLGYSRVGLKNI